VRTAHGRKTKRETKKDLKKRRGAKNRKEQLSGGRKRVTAVPKDIEKREEGNYDLVAV